MIKKTLITLLVLVAVGVAALLLYIEHNLAYAPIAPSRITVENIVIPREYSPETVTDIAADSAVLVSVLLSPNRTPSAAVILLHGIASCKEHMLPEAQTLADSGFAVLVPDLRAHGKSGGRYCSFGAKEKEDVKLLVARMQRTFPGIPVVLKGHSLGAAISIQVLAEDGRIAGAVLSAGFARLDNTLYNYMVRQTGIPYRAVSDYILSRSGARAGFNPFSINPAEYARRVKQPVLLLHGQFDEKIPLQDCIEIFENLTNKRTEVYIVRNAGHDNLRQLGGTPLIAKEVGFIKSVLISQ